MIRTIFIGVVAVGLPCWAHGAELGELMLRAATGDGPVSGRLTGHVERNAMAAFPTARGGVHATLRVVRSLPLPADMCKRIQINLQVREIPTPNDGPLVDWKQRFEVPWCPADAHFTVPLFVRNPREI